MHAHVPMIPTFAPRPVAERSTALTPRGIVAVQAIRLGYAMQDLQPADRAFIVSMLRELIEDATA